MMMIGWQNFLLHQKQWLSVLFCFAFFFMHSIDNRKSVYVLSVFPVLLNNEELSYCLKIIFFSVGLLLSVVARGTGSKGAGVLGCCSAPCFLRIVNATQFVLFHLLIFSI